MATGSEVHLMLEAHDSLEKAGVKVRSISLPCLELFANQPLEYIQSVLPDACRARVSIEAATSHSWGAFIGLDGEHVGMITFGSSAPIKKLQQELGFTAEKVVDAARRVMSKRPRTMDSYAEVQQRWKKQRSFEAPPIEAPP